MFYTPSGGLRRGNLHLLFYVVLSLLISTPSSFRKLRASSILFASPKSPHSCFWFVSSSTRTGNCLLILLILTDMQLFYFSQCWAKSAALLIVGTCFSTERWIGCKLVRNPRWYKACEQALCLGKGWKNREKVPLLAIFSPFRNREPVHRPYNIEDYEQACNQFISLY